MGALHVIDRAELPIPADVMPGKGWSSVMIEMAAHIGARDVLRLCDCYGGQQVYFPVEAANAPFVEILGRAKAKRLCQLYRRERLTIPTAHHALAVARRGGVLAAVRIGAMTVGQAAAKLHLRRDTVARLVKTSAEGRDSAAIRAATPRHDTRQIELFGELPGGAA